MSLTRPRVCPAVTARSASVIGKYATGPPGWSAAARYSVGPYPVPGGLRPSMLARVLLQMSSNWNLR